MRPRGTAKVLPPTRAGAILRRARLRLSLLIEAEKDPRERAALRQAIRLLRRLELRRNYRSRRVVR